MFGNPSQSESAVFFVYKERPLGGTNLGTLDRFRIQEKTPAPKNRTWEFARIWVKWRSSGKGSLPMSSPVESKSDNVATSPGSKTG